MECTVLTLSAFETTSWNVIWNNTKPSTHSSTVIFRTPTSSAYFATAPYVVSLMCSAMPAEAHTIHHVNLDSTSSLSQIHIYQSTWSIEGTYKQLSLWTHPKDFHPFNPPIWTLGWGPYLGAPNEYSASSWCRFHDFQRGSDFRRVLKSSRISGQITIFHLDFPE